jgi:uncharacterized phage protein (TIGR01671 family)
MRELKFRAWDSVDERYYFWNIEDCFRVGVHAGCMEKYTFEQYTGLKDENGKEIYEGDIVGFKWTKRLYIVTYRIYDASFILENDEWEETIHLSLDKDDFEVFGNIHENPELLEDGKWTEMK